MASKIQGIETCDQHVAKRQKLCGKDEITNDAGNSLERASELSYKVPAVHQECDNGPHASCSSFSDVSLRIACDNIKQKYLSAFSSKLSMAQPEFNKSYTQNSDLSRDLIRKIEEALVTTLNNGKSSRIVSRFRSISGLKYHMQTGLDRLAASRKGMRKEYPHARSLAIAQAQILQAYDEINMATSRLRLAEDEDHKALDALSEEELPSASGLVQAKEKVPLESPNPSSVAEGAVTIPTSTEQKNGCIPTGDKETCPVCQDPLTIRKMVFPCGHLACCKCKLPSP
ncbi:hypothetical protein C1H46_015862 [Malus baccata]|uniref:RING-type domain-containing protein n=1 Tax=Malus baccata TaxID=106549 RepID=A0A540MIM9_MALBA|nr:hypothetical protein C1H46_015862 [Malus baccata]